MIVESFSSLSCRFWRSNSPSILGMLMSVITISTSQLAFSTVKASTPSLANKKADGPVANLMPELLLDERLQVRFVVDN